MFGIFSRRPQRKTFVVADIDSDGAAVAFVRVSAQGPAIIAAAQRVALSFEDRAPDHAKAGIARALEEAVQKTTAEYVQKGGTAPEAVYAVFGQPWTRSKMGRAETFFNDDQKVDDATIGALARQALTEEKDIDTRQLLEASVSRIDLNGYPTKDPEGKKARSAAVSVLLSDVDPDVRQSVQAALQKYFPGTEVRLRSRTRALINLAADRDAASKNYVAIDVGGEGTSIAVVRKGALAEQVLAGEGMRSMLARVSGKGLPEETLSMMRMIEKDQCTGEQCEAISQALASTEPELMKSFGESFAKLSAGRRLPNPLVLVAHPDIAPWLSRFFARLDFGQFTATSQPFTVQTLLPQDLGRWVVPESGVQADAHITLGCALVHIEEH